MQLLRQIPAGCWFCSANYTAQPKGRNCKENASGLAEPQSYLEHLGEPAERHSVRVGPQHLMDALHQLLRDTRVGKASYKGEKTLVTLNCDLYNDML